MAGFFYSLLMEFLELLVQTYLRYLKGVGHEYNH